MEIVKSEINKMNSYSDKLEKEQKSWEALGENIPDPTYTIGSIEELVVKRLTIKNILRQLNLAEQTIIFESAFGGTKRGTAEILEVTKSAVSQREKRIQRRLREKRKRGKI